MFLPRVQSASGFSTGLTAEPACLETSTSGQQRHPTALLTFPAPLVPCCSDLSNRGVVGTLATGLRKAGQLQTINFENNR